MRKKGTWGGHGPPQAEASRSGKKKETNKKAIFIYAIISFLIIFLEMILIKHFKFENSQKLVNNYFYEIIILKTIFRTWATMYLH